MFVVDGAVVGVVVAVAASHQSFLSVCLVRLLCWFCCCFRCFFVSVLIVAAVDDVFVLLLFLGCVDASFCLLVAVVAFFVCCC